MFIVNKQLENDKIRISNTLLEIISRAIFYTLAEALCLNVRWP